ncbi:hypothetical protein [Flavobacterium xanthum]|uniref:SPOR domain-containing protein n=1 Tax=Flavobacterium xanthum TaxID=69322 RepID=A0A1M7LAG8_9FLAO|nr:hypothetical protein [Flavobacterium xanthum]SHM74791.1 hypothetical protein SAMN05443669_10664 [Flavobacterium xanthum]
MKDILKKTVIVFLMIFGFTLSSTAQVKKKADKATEEWRYEIDAVQTGTQGNYLIKVWSYSKKPEVAIDQAKKNAVHGIIFKGFTGTQSVPGQKPLTNNVNLEVEKEDFFKPFFADGGKYMKFVSMSTDGAVAAEDRMKVGKEYKIGVIVSVNVANLRKDLEEAGIIKSLGAGFN